HPVWWQRARKIERARDSRGSKNSVRPSSTRAADGPAPGSGARRYLTFSASSSASCTLDGRAQAALDAMVSPSPTAAPGVTKTPIANEKADASFIKPPIGG